MSNRRDDEVSAASLPRGNISGVGFARARYAPAVSWVAGCWPARPRSCSRSRRWLKRPGATTVRRRLMATARWRRSPTRSRACHSAQLPAGFRYRSDGVDRRPARGRTHHPARPRRHGRVRRRRRPGHPGPQPRARRRSGVRAGTGVYDPAAGSGTTLLSFDPRSERIGRAPGPRLAGTVRNCAGGPTPWGTWLTCEETVLGPATRTPAEEAARLRLRGAAGREAERATRSRPWGVRARSGRRRSRAAASSTRPRTAARLSLHAGDARPPRRRRPAADAGRPRAAPSRSADRTAGAWYSASTGSTSTTGARTNRTQRSAGLFRQGHAAGGVPFGRLEGAWHAGGRIFVTSTNGGKASMGQVWELDTGPRSSVWSSNHQARRPQHARQPEVTPRGGLVMCEDGTANPCLHVLTRDGRSPGSLATTWS